MPPSNTMRSFNLYVVLKVLLLLVHWMDELNGWRWLRGHLVSFFLTAVCHDLPSSFHLPRFPILIFVFILVLLAPLSCSSSSFTLPPP